MALASSNCWGQSKDVPLDLLSVPLIFVYLESMKDYVLEIEWESLKAYRKDSMKGPWMWLERMTMMALPKDFQ